MSTTAVPSSDIAAFRRALASSKKILVLTGAGLSAASGIPTYRGPNGLWCNHDALQLVTPAAFRDSPSRIWRFQHDRREIILRAKPNAAHHALARICFPILRSKLAPYSEYTIITQNIDELHSRALEDVAKETGMVLEQADVKFFEMHGRVYDVLCTDPKCGHCEKNQNHPIVPALGVEESSSAQPEEGDAIDNASRQAQVPLLATIDASDQNSSDKDLPAPREPLLSAIRNNPIASLRKTGLWPAPERAIPLSELPRCTKCGALARPGEVWFGEAAMHMDEILKLVDEADMCLVVGTSSTIHPAATFAEKVKSHGGKVAFFNIEHTKREEVADFLFLGPCENLLPDAIRVEDDGTWEL